LTILFLNTIKKDAVAAGILTVGRKYDYQWYNIVTERNLPLSQEIKFVLSIASAQMTF
jgi:hypothetical protein